jgi:SAM-dependent methyltransferase
MPFIAYKISDYEHTAEREQYRTMCNKLRNKYSKSEELCVFIANYNIYDCELDGIIIKSDAIIGVEFKNYGGNVIATHNGQWKLADGTIIKGGSNKTVYQQAKLNHIAIRKGLLEGNILPQKMLEFIPFLIVFNNPITLQNRLNGHTKSWLRISDVDHFIEKVEDITTPKFYLSNEQIIKLNAKLGLEEEFIDDRFTAYEPTIPSEEPTKVGSTICSEDTNIVDTCEKTKSDDVIDLPDDKKKCLDFLKRSVIPDLNLHDKYDLNLFHYMDYETHVGLPLPFKSEYVAVLDYKDAGEIKAKLNHLIHKDIVSLNESILAWGEGEMLLLPNEKAQQTEQYKKTSNNCRLPQWLDDFIFSNLGAVYQPAYSRFEFNIDLTAEESKIYLGTYFPRSYAESYLIFSQLFRSETIKSIISAKRSIKILDFGCGSGGEIFGFLQALEDVFSSYICVEVVGIDGNNNSLRLFEKIVTQYNSKCKHHVNLIVAPAYIETETDFNDIAELIGTGYDFIITSKAIGEFERRKQISQNGYEFFSYLFSPLLSDMGIMIIIDVTIKDTSTNLFLPQRMNFGVNRFLEASAPAYQSLAPCTGKNAVGYCKQECFFKYETSISHSKRSNDISKFAFRILSRKDLCIENSIFNNNMYNISCPIK